MPCRWATPPVRLLDPASRSGLHLLGGRLRAHSPRLPGTDSPHHGRLHGPRWRGLCQTDGLHRHLRRPLPRVVSPYLESAHGSAHRTLGAPAQDRHPANTYLNKLSLADYRKLFSRHFDILQETCVRPNLGSQFMTPEIRLELNQYPDEELFSNAVIFLLRPRRKPSSL